MDSIELQAAVPVAAPTPQAPGRPSAVVLEFRRRDPAGLPAGQAGVPSGAKPSRGLKPFKHTDLPGVYAHPLGDGSAPLRLRVRDPRRRNAKSGAPVRHNIALGLDQHSSIKDIAARVAEIERKLAQGWNPRGAQLTLREVFYNDVLPRIRQQSRSPKTALSRFQSLIEPYLGDMAIGDITAADLRRWRDRLLAEGAR